MQTLRTPDERFLDLPGYSYTPRYVQDLPGFEGLRLHYLDEGKRDSAHTFLCLHGQPTWSYLYRKMIPVFLSAGNRVVALDLIGFGKSDKPKKEGAHTFDWHRQVLAELVERLDLKNVVLVLQNEGDLLGSALPLADERRYCGLLVANLTPDASDAAYEAPFPDPGHRAALRAFATMVPTIIGI